jgi:Na+-translocating ferredoxin:NAD+ oxidoreductase subunit C
MKLHRMHGGLELEGHKQRSTAQPIGTVPRPALLVLPLLQHAGTMAVPLVSVGERVTRYQPLASPGSYISAPIHAPASGTVVAIEARPLPHPSGLHGSCIVIETDPVDTDWDGVHRYPDWPTLDPVALRDRVRDAGIVGLGGAAFPTHVKLGSANVPAVEVLILNGAECEPYISCDDRLMRERAAEVVSGAAIMLRALQARRCIIAVEADKPEARAALDQATGSTDDIVVVEVPAIYPQGGERQLVHTLTGRTVPSNGLPMDIGVVCQNVGTAAAVHRAIVEGRPLVSRVVTVTGGAVHAPRNMEALIGTPVRALIDACGGYTATPDRLLLGGPMMGFPLVDDDVPVVKATNCILAAAPGELRKPPPEMPCIRCTECAEVCPANLLPQQLHWAVRAQDLDEAQGFQLADCIECGCCDVVCPSHIPLVDEFRWAKGEIRHREEERQKAELAKRRFEARAARLETERLEREARLKGKRDPAAIEAEIQRIKRDKANA